MRRALIAFAALAACNGTTGSALVSFHAVAGGAADLAPGLAFDTGQGFRVTLDRARLHLGAVYLNQSVPSSGAQEASCVLPGIYVGQVFGPLDLDLLSPELVPFPSVGEGTATAAKAGEVWLSGGAIDALDDATVILDLAGTATRAAQSLPFSASVTIGQNRAIPVQSTALPGSNPICHRRIVTPIRVDLTPSEGGTLALRVDPRGMLNGVDFSALVGGVIPDENGGQGGALFAGLFAGSGVYDFAWSQ